MDKGLSQYMPQTSTPNVLGPEAVSHRQLPDQSIDSYDPQPHVCDQPHFATMRSRSRSRRGRASERSPLMPGGPQAHYGCADPILPPYSPTFGNHGRGGEGTHAYHHQGGPSHNHEGDSSHHRIIWFAVGGLTALVLFFVPYLMVDIYLNDIGRKISRWNEAMGRMRERENAMGMEARHLERERIALRDESTRLGKERLTLESTITKMEGEKRALDSAIRHSEQERSRLETQKQLLAEERSRLEMEKSSLEDKRRSLERQELTLREERERWEKARDEQTIPKGAFWEVVWPAWDCRAYGKREYWGLLRNIPEGRSEMDACMNMPVEIKGVHIRRPYRCQYVDGSIHGFWMVDWDQPDCKPWHQNFVDKGCTNWGSGLRRLEAEVVGINNKGGQDWRLLCETTPMIWNHIMYNSPAHCEDRGTKIAAWDVPDDIC